MLSSLIVAAVIVMTLFANIYYNQQCLVCTFVIGFNYLGLTSKIDFLVVFQLTLHDYLLTSEISLTVI
jgi:hypothetical protein